MNANYDTEVGDVQLYKDFGFVFVETPTTETPLKFVTINNEVADYIRGELPDGAEEHHPVMFVGTGRKHYYTSKDTEKLEEAVLERFADSPYVLVENVDGGWKRWDGRPEFSETYADLRNARVVKKTR